MPVKAMKAKEAKEYADTPFGRMEVVRVPDELIAELMAESDLALAQMESGEFDDISLEELAIEMGVDLDDE